MKIGTFDLERDILIVAEIGNNHEGNLEVAQELVRKAAECGVGAVKFQTYKTEFYVSKLQEERFRRLKSFELSYSQFENLTYLAHKLGLLFISTPFDIESAAFLNSIVDCFKISSGDNTFYPLIDRIIAYNKPAIISTGISDYNDIKKIVEFLKVSNKDLEIADVVALLHCVSCYPVPVEQTSLCSIRFLVDNFDLTIGYSDHTQGIESSILSVAMGARIIEKHFTLNKQFSNFRDHQLSADPLEMERLVSLVKTAQKMVGQYNKTVQKCEKSFLVEIRRSIVACRDLSHGTHINLSDITWIRPGGGLAPGQEDRLVGKKLKRDIKFGEMILESDVE